MMEDICVSDNLSKMERTSHHVDRIFNNNITMESFKFFKKAKMSGMGEATV